MPKKPLLVMAFLVSPVAAAAATTVPLTVGTTTIAFPEVSGYRALSSLSPVAFSLASAAIPPSNQLVEMFITQADLRRLHSGAALRDRYYQIQAPRKLTSFAVSVGQWDKARPSLVAGLTKLDTGTLLHEEQRGAGKRMGTVAHKTVDIQFGRLNSPVVYRETPASIRFDMTVPVSVKIANSQNAGVMLAAGSITLLHNKMVFVYIFGQSDQGAKFASLNKQLDATVDKLIELNANDAMP